MLENMEKTEKNRKNRRKINAMKATGIVRRIDDLGRVVVPKEIRRTLRIREGDPLEIFTDKEGEIILKKYSPIGEYFFRIISPSLSVNISSGSPSLILSVLLISFGTTTRPRSSILLTIPVAFIAFIFLLFFLFFSVFSIFSNIWLVC